jgi:hypothetical protein
MFYCVIESNVRPPGTYSYRLEDNVAPACCDESVLAVSV